MTLLEKAKARRLSALNAAGVAPKEAENTPLTFYRGRGQDEIISQKDLHVPDTALDSYRIKCIQTTMAPPRRPTSEARRNQRRGMDRIRINTTTCALEQHLKGTQMPEETQSVPVLTSLPMAA